MRTFAIVSMIIITTIVISITACENLFDDMNDKYNADTIYMFNTSNHNGNLGGRDGADTICQATYDAKFSNLGVKNVRAFINVSSDDEMRDMPENFGVPEDARIVGPTGILIDYNWAALLDGMGIQTNLGSAGMTFTGDYWTGSDNSGKGIVSQYSCGGWTNNSLTSIIGNNGTNASPDWLYEGGGPLTCSSSQSILCVAW